MPEVERLDERAHPRRQLNPGARIDTPLRLPRVLGSDVKAGGRAAGATEPRMRPARQPVKGRLALLGALLVAPRQRLNYEQRLPAVRCGRRPPQARHRSPPEAEQGLSADKEPSARVVMHSFTRLRS